jgi:hypothetical protein
MDCLKIRAKSLLRLYEKPTMNSSLKTVLYGPRNLCQTVRTVRKYTQKIIAVVTSISVPINGCTTALGCVPNSSKIILLSPSISVHEEWLYNL